ncbi:MAG: hypothetical protein HC841_08045 [Verrucomicrobiae bacterium]|nr:hypothetical protein [Verrucomicrobiae bacterium]
MIVLTGTTTALVAYNARQMAELVLHRLHCSAWRGALLLPSASVLLVLLHSYELYLLDRLLIPFGVATFAALVVIAPLLIDKRRVNLPPDRSAMLLWLPWCFSSAWFSIHWENYTAAIGGSLISATVLYLAWRNSRPKPSASAGTVAG